MANQPDYLLLKVTGSVGNGLSELLAQSLGEVMGEGIKAVYSFAALGLHDPPHKLRGTLAWDYPAKSHRIP
jgi:hypothetical protein